MMNDFDFDEFDSQFDSESLKKDLADVEAGNGERKEVPHGVYEVKITKLELIDQRLKFWQGKNICHCHRKLQLWLTSFVQFNSARLHRILFNLKRIF